MLHPISDSVIESSYAFRPVIHRQLYVHASPAPLRLCVLGTRALNLTASAAGRDDDDYDIDFYTVGPVPPSSSVDAHAQSPSVREQLEVGPFFLFRVASRPLGRADGFRAAFLLRMHHNSLLQIMA